MSSRTPPILTIIFTAPASCSSILTYDGSTFWRGQLSSTIGDPACYPPDYSQAWWYYYSPGVCPYGWTSASSLTGTGALVTNPAETNAICCPSSYFVGTGPSPDVNGLFCASTLLGAVTNVYSTSTDHLGPVPTDPILTTINVGAGSTAWADIIQVRWQSTDTEVLQIMASAESAASSTSASQISTRITPTVPPNTGSPTPNATHHILSDGTIAVIVISTCIVALLIAGLLLWIRRRRRQTLSSMTEDSKIYHSVAASHELDARHNERPLKGELDGKTKVELDSHIQPIELQVEN